MLTGVEVALDGRRVLAGIDAVVPDGAFAAVVGPSGSGKSTMLRTVGGLVGVDAGRIRFGEVDVTAAEPRERDVGMVFQAPTLFDHRTVRRNVSFPLELRRETVEAIRQRVDAETRAMHIEHLLTRQPNQLSHGEQQLVQIARTMVRAPRVLLLDEPFAPLDEHLRRRMRTEMRTLQAGYGVTTLMATNDPDDVAAVATHVVVLGPLDPTAAEHGTGTHTVVQAGTPGAVAADPASLDVATALGPLWTIDARVAIDGRGFWLVPIASPASRLRAWARGLGDRGGAPVVVAFRRGDLVVDPDGAIEAVVDRIVPGATEPLVCRIGRHVVHASFGGEQAASDRPSGSVFDLGRDDPVRLRPERMMVFDPADGSRLA